MDTDLKDKIAIVTGGARGIGKGIALALAEEGVHLAIADLHPDPNTLKEIETFGVRAVSLKVDVSKEDEVTEMVKNTITKLGGLHLYVNNAAAHWDEPATKLTTEGWLNSIHTNLSACAWGCREVSKYFITQGHGSIVIVGSTTTWNPLYKETSYRVSKTGLKAYFEVLAIELAPFGIRVNMVTPGWYPTELSLRFLKEVGGHDKEQVLLNTIPLHRAGKVSEIGAAAVFLLSDQLSAFTTGSELVVDGGAKLRPLPLYSEDEIRRMSV